MSDTIRISEKHGVNPSMDCCFWCGEPKGVALLGKLKGDAEAPRRIITNYEPCNKCKEIFSKGIHVIGVSHKPILEGMSPIGQDNNGKELYPDTSYFVAREDIIVHLFEDNEQAVENILETGKLLMQSSMVHEIIERTQKEDSEDESGESWISDSNTAESD